MKQFKMSISYGGRGVSLGVAVLLCLTLWPAMAHGERVEQNFNADWRFTKGDVAAASAADFDDASWESVVLPHSANIEPLVVNEQWQGLCWYRKTFTLGEEMSTKEVFVHFEGAMQVAELWLNGEFLLKHEGGYLPFTAELSEGLRFGEENVLAVRLDNRDNAQVPPGKPLKGLDFCYFSGIYRDVTLVVKDPLHITDAVHAGKVAGGGVFVTYPAVTTESATVQVKTHVVNGHGEARRMELRSRLVDSAGRVAAVEVSAVTEVAGAGEHNFAQTLEVPQPALWSPKHPALYTLESEVIYDGAVVDGETTRVGIRRFSITPEGGFEINGERMYLRGVNRHQEYPFIGNALSNSAQYRDALKIKEAGFDYVRLSHYPQDPAFMDACDELGLVVMDCIPGWQYMGDEHFEALCYQNSRDMMRRDRNHPCVILWEVSLNESRMSREFRETTHSIAHEEYPGDQCYTCGWVNRDYDVYIQARQHRLGRGPIPTERPYVISEYGDWEYYAQNAGLDQPGFKNLLQEERNSRQLRGDGEKRLLQQAMNFQEAFNDNLATTPAFGDGLWVMFDYNRGYDDTLEASGPMNIFRIAKPGYYFYRSQRDAVEARGDFSSGPMVFVANYWTPESDTAVRVYSNCEEVALYLNGVLVEKRSPDETPFTTHLPHAPFTFSLAGFEAGTLKAEGYIGGDVVAAHEVKTPGEAKGVRLTVDLSGRPLQADGADTVFVHAEVVDAAGTLVPGAAHEVRFAVEGAAALIGGEDIVAEAGIATLLLRAGMDAGVIRVKATAAGLETGELSVEAVAPKDAPVLRSLGE